MINKRDSLLKILKKPPFILKFNYKISQIKNKTNSIDLRIKLLKIEKKLYKFFCYKAFSVGISLNNHPVILLKIHEPHSLIEYIKVIDGQNFLDTTEMAHDIVYDYHSRIFYLRYYDLNKTLHSIYDIEKGNISHGWNEEIFFEDEFIHNKSNFIICFRKFSEYYRYNLNLNEVFFVNKKGEIINNLIFEKIKLKNICCRTPKDYEYFVGKEKLKRKYGIYQFDLNSKIELIDGYYDQIIIYLNRIVASLPIRANKIYFALDREKIFLKSLLEPDKYLEIKHELNYRLFLFKLLSETFEQLSNSEIEILAEMLNTFSEKTIPKKEELRSILFKKSLADIRSSEKRKKLL